MSKITILFSDLQKFVNIEPEKLAKSGAKNDISHQAVQNRAEQNAFCFCISVRKVKSAKHRNNQ